MQSHGGPGRGAGRGDAAPAVQVLVLGAIFVVLAFMGDAAYAWLGGGPSVRRPADGALTRRISGGVLVALGLGAGFSRA